MLPRPLLSRTPSGPEMRISMHRPLTSSQLRRYACLCAREAARIAHIAVADEVFVAERVASRLASAEDFERARTAAQPRAAAAGMVGLPRCLPTAAAVLSASHTCDENAHGAAYWAAEFAVKTAIFRDARWHAANWHWEEDKGEPWRATWRTAEWIKRHPVAVHELAEAVSRTLLQLKRSLGQPIESTGRVIAFPRLTEDSAEER